MKERQLVGIAAAKAAGKYIGRKATAMAVRDEIVAMLGSGMTREAVAKQLGISVASVYRALRMIGSGTMIRNDGENNDCQMVVDPLIVQSEALSTMDLIHIDQL